MNLWILFLLQSDFKIRFYMYINLWDLFLLQLEWIWRMVSNVHEPLSLNPASCGIELEAWFYMYINLWTLFLFKLNFERGLTCTWTCESWSCYSWIGSWAWFYMFMNPWVLILFLLDWIWSVVSHDRCRFSQDQIRSLGVLWYSSQVSYSFLADLEIIYSSQVSYSSSADLEIIYSSI